jgi:hypothetical protein
MAVGTNMEAELPSVLVAPVLAMAEGGGRVMAIIYLLKRDISHPFGDEDLDVLRCFCEVFGEVLSHTPPAGDQVR